jgi:large subunit ribosomal protein LP1
VSDIRTGTQFTYLLVSFLSMASVEVSKLSQAEREELLCSYAALILHDEKADITADNINKLVKAAGGEVEPYWPTLFARALKSVQIGDLLKNASAAPAAAPAAAGAGSASPKKGAASPKKAAKKEEEEEAGDMGFSLFD